MQRIIYNGLERADFIYYLSVVLSRRSARVIVNDVSGNHDLYKAVSKGCDDPYFEWNNIVFTNSLNEKDISLNEDDIYIEYRGMNVHPGWFHEDAYHFIMPDYTAEGISLVNTCVPQGKAIYIFRDMCTKKVTDKSIALLCNLQESDIAGHLTLSFEDIAAYVALTHNGSQKMSRLSEDMKMALKYSAGKILDIHKEKDVAKLYKEANRIINK